MYLEKKYPKRNLGKIWKINILKILTINKLHLKMDIFRVE